MDQRPFANIVARLSHAPGRGTTALLLLAIALLGGYFRTVNLSNWDGGTGHHPDERFMHYTVVNLSLPSDWRAYFVTTCPSPMPAPRNPQDAPEDWAPSDASGCSTLNPRNFAWSRGYVYGTLPTTLTRLAVDALDRTDLRQIVVTGRALSVAMDLLALLATFGLASLIFDRRVGLLAAALYAGAVMPIQQSHYFTVDAFAVGFGAIALFFITRLGLKGRWFDAVLSGMFIAAATASKINMAALAGLAVVAAIQLAVAGFRDPETRRPEDPETENQEPENKEQSKIQNPKSKIDVIQTPNSAIFRAALLLIVTGAVCFAAFRVFQPDAFRGPNWWNIGLDDRFRDLIRQARLTADGTLDLPSSHQWADRAPYLFPWRNMVLWGMGLPLGLAAWLGWAAAGWRLIARRHMRQLVPWLWITGYFAWQGRQFVTTMRYFLPIYGPLIIFAAWALIAAVRWAVRRRGARAYPEAWPARRLRGLQRPALAVSLLALVLLGTWSWAWAYTRIYTQTYTRVAAAAWIQRAAPNGATTTWELWDDPLPLPFTYEQIVTHPYAEEELSKYLGVPDGTADNEGLIRSLARADYVVLTSPRVYGSVERVPQRFPALLRYYRSLFDGSLGYELAADIHAFPSLFGLPINDLSAEEAFWVYDHPRVLIFRRTENFSAERARQIITGDVAWDEIYRGLRPAQINAAPTALQLPARAWELLQASDARGLFASSSRATALVLWLLAIEALGIAAAGLIWRLGLPLPDRGLGLARVAGLLLFALPLALLGVTQTIRLSHALLLIWYAAIIVAGVALLWRARESFRAFARDRRALLLTPQAIYFALLTIGLVMPLGADALHESRWAALVRAPALPPYDSTFAGGLDPAPYAAKLPFAFLDRLLGIAPAWGLRLALATALALLVATVWSAIRAATARPASGWMAIIGALLTLGSGLPFGAWRELSLWAAWRRADLDVLGLALIAAAALTLGAACLRPLTQPRARWALLALIVVALAIVRGYGLAIFLGLWLLIAALLWTGARGRRRRWMIDAGVLLVAPALLGSTWAWNIAPPAPAPAITPLAPAVMLLGLLLPIAIITVYTIMVASRLADRLSLALAGSAVAIWSAIVLLLNWSAALLTLPLAMTLLWLAAQAWLPGPWQRRRDGAFLCTGAVAFGLLGGAALTHSGLWRGDPAAQSIVATVTLAVLAGWTLPIILRRHGRRLTREPQRLRDLGRIATGGVLIVALLGAIMTARASEQPESSLAQPVVAAAQWLGQHANGAPVVATSPQGVSHVTRVTGLPALLNDAQRQQRARDIVQPAVGGVIGGRDRALQSIYGGDALQAETTLRTYHVGYAVVGPDERATYGTGAGAALRELAQRGAIGLVYDRDGVQIYESHLSSGRPPFVPPQRLTPPSTRTLMLDRPVAELPAVDEYAWNRLASEHQLVGILLWLLVIQALGLLAFPITATIFRRWHDRGWGVSKIVGLLIWGYAVWLPVNLGWWIFNRWALVAGAGALLVLGVTYWVVGRRTRHSSLGTRHSLRAIARSEVCFLIAFGVWTWVRAANPDLWHPAFGGEKPMEFGILNAILRAPVLPPPDPFFSGGIVNYYYYGLFLVALPIKAIGIAPAIGFNLAIVTLFALMASATLALGREISGHWRYGLVALLFMLGIGPVATVVQVQESQGIGVVIDALRQGVSGFGARLGWWFWGPSRVIPYTINEFPLWGFLFADLHPHLIALPITLLAIALAVDLLRDGPRRATLALAALTIGALAIANSWDAPTYALLLGGALAGRAWRLHRSQRRIALLRMTQAALLAVAVVAAGLLLYLPFFLHYRAMVGGVGLTRAGDTVREYALLYGPFLYVAITLLGGLIWAVVYRARAPWRRVARGATVALPLVIAAIVLSGGNLQQTASDTGGWPLRILLLLLASAGVVLLFVARLRDRDWLPLWLITVALLVALGIQFVFIRDHLAGSPYERMNTVFKFGEQIWVLLALGAATALPLTLRILRQSETLYGLWLGALIALLIPGLLYAPIGIANRLSVRFDQTLPLTLDGLAFMSHARYQHNDREIDLRPDAEAIAWLNEHIAGMPVFATSELEFYRAYGMRVAANTGLPTVLGRLHQDEQRPAAQVVERERDVQTLFNTSDSQAALRVLAKYAVDYVYIGPVERALYDPLGIAKFARWEGTVLERVYGNDGVDIYRVNREAVSQLVATTALPAAVEALTPSIEDQIASLAHDSGAAFGLATRLIEQNQLDDAARVLEAAAAQHPADVPLHHLLGDVLARIGRPDEAVAAWRKAAETQPTALNVNKLGQGLMQLGRYDEAIAAFNEALAIDPAFPDPHFFLGELYRMRDGVGDRQRAREAYQRYLDRAPPDGLWRVSAEEQLRLLER